MTQLQQARERAGLSRNRLAALSGLDGGTIYRIEKGEALPHISTAYALARALGNALNEEIRIDDLFPISEEAAAATK